MRWRLWVGLLAVLALLAACDSTTSIKGSGGSESGGRGRVKMGIPF